MQLKSKVYIHLAESAKGWLFYQEGSYKMHAIVYLVLTWIIYFTWNMFTYSPQEKIKMTLFKSLHTLNSLYCVVTWMIHSCVFLFSDSCSWVPLSWTVKLPAVLWKNPSVPTNYLVFQHFCAFEPFPTMTMILRSIFSHRGQLKDSFATITEDSNAHWCSRRRKKMH